MIWILIAFAIVISSFSIQGIYAQDEGKPILECREKIGKECSESCKSQFSDPIGDDHRDYTKCLNQCISERVGECPPLPPYELDFAQESTTCPKAVYMDEKHEKYSINAIQCVEKKIENCDLLKTTFWYIAGPLNLSLQEDFGYCSIDILQQDWGDYGSRPYEYKCSFTEINEWKSWQNSTGGTFYNDLADCGEVIQEELTPQTIKNMVENLSPEFKTPKQQTNVGILPSEVQCKEGLQLIFKSTDGSPACVKPKTAEKLIERGWALEISSIDSFEECVAAGNPVMESYPRQCRTSDGKHFVEEIEGPPPVVLETEKNIYSKGEWVTVTITNLINEGYHYGVEIFDPEGKPFFDCLIRAQSIPQISPNETTSQSWELSKDCRDEPTLPGRYTVLFSSEFGHAVHYFTVR